jgi:hypothetical protein
MDSLALLMLQYLLDTFEPRARHIAALTFAVGSDQNDLALHRPEEIDNPCATPFSLALGDPAQFAAATVSGYEVSCFGLIAQKSLKSKKLVVGKERVSQLSKWGQFYELPKHESLYGNAVYNVKKELIDVEDDSTDVEHRGRLPRSSDEVSVMEMERRG